MRTLLLAGSTLLLLPASVATAAAAPIFSFTAPGFYFPTLAPGAYDIVATGAGGGNGATFTLGGLGAVVEGTFTFAAPETLRVLVGGQGGTFPPEGREAAAAAASWSRPGPRLPLC